MMLKIHSQNQSKLIVLHPLSVVCERQHTQVKMISALTHLQYNIYFKEISIYCNTIKYNFHTETEN